MLLKKFLLIPLVGFALLAGCKKDDVKLNEVPVADAGTAQSLTLSDVSVTLTGSGSDADGIVVAYLWSQVSGPAESTIVNPGSSSTEVRFSAEGEYVFQLMVTDDKGATGVDTTTIIVNPNPIQTATFQPSNNPTEFQVGYYNGTDESGAGAPHIALFAWTKNGNTYTAREILKFDLSSIPVNATIISANLYLYSYPAPLYVGNFTDANYGTDNSMLVQQVSTNWSTGTLNWFNQPSGISSSQIVVPHTSQSFLDMNLDVTNMVSSMVSNNANYGFLLKIQNEVIYTNRTFVSSYSTEYPDKHPKLVIVYK